MSASWPSATLALTRFVFGFAMLVSCIRFMVLGWIADQYVQPMMHFPYYGFEWVQPLDATGMQALYIVMTLAAAMVMVGFRTRMAGLTFAVLFTYVELIDKAYYLNHYYFVSIMAFMLCLLPTNLVWSVDAWLKPAMRRTYVPRWCVDAVKLQIALVYVFAGVAKINADWLLHALPLKLWLPAHSDLPVAGPLLTEPWIAYMFSWCGMLFDCTAPFLLMWRRSRPFAYVLLVVFHVFTGILFQIGVFPVVMILMTLVFFDPPRWMHRAEYVAEGVAGGTYRVPRVVMAILAVHLVFQLLIPLRFMLYPGNLFWTEEGYRYSWRVMLMEKAGSATFFVRDGVKGREGVVVNSEFLNVHQEKQMSMQPDMVLAFAHLLRDHYRSQGMRDPVIRAEVWVTLNGRRSRLLIDPNVNLAALEDGFAPYPWVIRYVE